MHRLGPQQIDAFGLGAKFAPYGGRGRKVLVRQYPERLDSAESKRITD